MKSLKNDEWFSINTQPVANDFGAEIVRLYIKDGQLHFEGNMADSAKVFFEMYLKPMCDRYIQERLL